MSTEQGEPPLHARKPGVGKSPEPAAAAAGKRIYDIHQPPETVQYSHAAKNDVRIENEVYLRQHPEIRDMIGYFLKRCLLDKPADIASFAEGPLCVASEGMDFTHHLSREINLTNNLQS